MAAVCRFFAGCRVSRKRESPQAKSDLSDEALRRLARERPDVQAAKLAGARDGARERLGDDDQLLAQVEDLVKGQVCVQANIQ